MDRLISEIYIKKSLKFTYKPFIDLQQYDYLVEKNKIVLTLQIGNIKIEFRGPVKNSNQEAELVMKDPRNILIRCLLSGDRTKYRAVEVNNDVTLTNIIDDPLCNNIPPNNPPDTPPDNPPDNPPNNPPFNPNPPDNPVIPSVNPIPNINPIPISPCCPNPNPPCSPEVCDDQITEEELQDSTYNTARAFEESELDLINQPCEFSTQPSGFTSQPSGFTSQPSGLPNQPCGLPNQPCGMPNQPCGMPNQPCGMPNQPCGMPNQPGGMPNQSGGMPNQSCGMPNQSCGIPNQPCVMTNQPPQAGYPSSTMCNCPPNHCTCPSNLMEPSQQNIEPCLQNQPINCTPEYNYESPQTNYENPQTNSQSLQTNYQNTTYQSYMNYMQQMTLNPSYQYLKSNPNNIASTLSSRNILNSYLGNINETFSNISNINNNINFNNLPSILVKFIFNGQFNGETELKLNRCADNSTTPRFNIVTGPFGIGDNKLRIDYRYGFKTTRNRRNIITPIWKIEKGFIDFSSLLRFSKEES